MRLPTPYVRPIRLRDQSGYENAKKHYRTLPKLKIEEDILWYFKNGWLHASPTCFAMACVINIAPEDTNLVQPAWFIRYAWGDLLEIMRLLPCYFEYIVWCRNDEGGGTIMRQWRTDRLFKIAVARKKSGISTGTQNSGTGVRAGSTPARADRKESAA